MTKKWVGSRIQGQGLKNNFRISFKTNLVKIEFNNKLHHSSCCQKFQNFHRARYRNFLRKSRHDLAPIISNHHPQSCLVRIWEHSAIIIRLQPFLLRWWFPLDIYRQDFWSTNGCITTNVVLKWLTIWCLSGNQDVLW